MEEKLSLNQMKWRMGNQIWKNTFEQNVQSLCVLFKVPTDEGYPPRDILTDFHLLIRESILELNELKEEEQLGKNNYHDILAKYAIKQTISVGAKKFGNQDIAIKKLCDAIIKTCLDIEEKQSQYGFFKKMKMKISISVRLLFSRIFG
jgi:hypothetical protein